MKNKDHSFKLLAAVIIAGVIAAFIPSVHAGEKATTRNGASAFAKNADGTVAINSTETDFNSATASSSATAGKTIERTLWAKLNRNGSGTRVIETIKPDGTTETRREKFTVTNDAGTQS